MDDHTGWRTSRDIDVEVRREVQKTRQTGNHLVGYGKPPPDTRWKPGQSGNPKGRPKKVERSITERQRLRDFFNATERQVTITIEGKRKKVTLVEAIMEQGILQAAKGRYRFFAKFIDMYAEAVRLSATLNPKATSLLESVEQHLAEVGDERQSPPQFIDQLNKLKRKTRKF